MIKDELREELKDAMRSGDDRRRNVIRLIESDADKARTAPEFDGDIDDAFYITVIDGFVKRNRKSLQEYEELGDEGKETVRKLKWEIGYLARWLPDKLSPEETLILVRASIAELGAADAKDVGRVIGHVMKSHPNQDQLDGSMVAQIVRAALGA